MSSYEDPVTTVIRLLSKNIRVVKEDSSVASIYGFVSSGMTVSSSKIMMLKLLLALVQVRITKLT